MAVPLRTFLLLFFCAALMVSAPARAILDEEESWLNIYDFYERQAFSNYGPPLREDNPRFGEEARLYLDMVEHYFVVSEDEDEFDFLVEAFSVPVDVFRPASFRPDGIIDDGLFADDPLPQIFKSTSYYVDTIRPSHLPGPSLQPRPLDEVDLGNNNVPRSLFEDPKPPEKKAEDSESDLLKEKPADKKKAENEDPIDTPAGKINAPKKPPRLPSSDEETLKALQQAVRELGLEKELNFEPNAQNKQTRGMLKDANENAQSSAAPSEEGADKTSVPAEKSEVTPPDAQEQKPDVKPDAKKEQPTSITEEIKKAVQSNPVQKKKTALPKTKPPEKKKPIPSKTKKPVKKEAKKAVKKKAGPAPQPVIPQAAPAPPAVQEEAPPARPTFLKLKKGL